jgi:RND family efflux transporter MFP subunit
MKRLFCAFFFGVLLLSGCAKQATSEKQTDIVRPVGAYKVVMREFVPTVEISASILASKQVTLMAKLPAEVKKVPVVEGQFVRKGEPLVILDDKDYQLAMKQALAQREAAKAGLKAAEVAFENASSTFKRFSSLKEKEAVPDNDYEKVETGYKAAMAQLEVARAQVKLAEVGVEAARTNLEYTVVRAPFDGVVGTIMVSEGDRIQVMPPTPLLLFAQISELKVVGAVVDRELGLVKEGIACEVVVDQVLDAPIQAKVDRIDPILDPKTRAANVHVLIQNPDMKLRPFMSARIRVKGEPKKALSVPDDAIIRPDLGGSKGFVFVIRDGVAKRQEIETGLRNGAYFEVVRGLQEGVLIVRGGQTTLVDGQKVEVKEVSQ